MSISETTVKTWLSGLARVGLFTRALTRGEVRPESLERSMASKAALGAVFFMSELLANLRSVSPSGWDLLFTLLKLLEW